MWKILYEHTFKGTPFPSGPFVCPETYGVFADPEGCSSFYLCLQDMPHKFDCDGDDGFDETLSRCDANGCLSKTPTQGTKYPSDNKSSKLNNNCILF